ncbi:MAG: cobalamin biosynthesis protein CbiG [Alphaproteobacteria bacterium]
MPSFDAYLMVDWSAAATPRRGADSIWIGLTRRGRIRTRLSLLENLPTRAVATARIGDILSRLLRRGDRVLAGFDFPFGYPAGTAARLGLPGLPWRHMWQLLDDSLADGPDNRNNRYALAAGLNARLGGEAFPFWGHGSPSDIPLLLRRGRRPHGPDDLAERRLCDRRLPGAQPVWKLAGIGSVGGQALTGIPRVWQLRRDPRLALATQIWPFETGLADDPRAQLVLAEVYPSIVPPLPLPGLPRDAGQVAAVGRHLAGLDAAGRLAPLFAADPALSAAERRAVEREEAWVLGVADRVVR